MISAGIERLTGPDSFWAKNLLMSLCGLAGLWLAWASLRRLVQPPLAAAAVIATAATTVYCHHSHLILTDAPFAMLFWAIAYTGLRMRDGSWAWGWAVAALFAVTILIRMPALTILGPLAVAMLVQARRGPQPGAAPGPDAPTAVGKARRVGVGVCIFLSIVATAAAFQLAIRHFYDRPSSYLVGQFSASRGPLHRLTQLGPLVFRLPETVGELVTGRQGWLFWALGLGLLVLVGTGLSRQWRRGLRLPAVAIGLSLLTMALTGGLLAAKARYYMPLEPLIFLALIEGVVATRERRARRLMQGYTQRTRIRTVWLVVVAIGLVNAPFLARTTIYETAVGHRGRYQQAIAGGIFADLYPTADFLREHVQPGQIVLARHDRTRMLHFLTRLPIGETLSFGDVQPWNAAQADETYRVLAHSPFDWLVFDPGVQDARYTTRLAELLDATGGLDLAWRHGIIRIYRRTGPLTPGGAGPAASAPANAPTATTKPTESGAP